MTFAVRIRSRVAPHESEDQKAWAPARAQTVNNEQIENRAEPVVRAI